MRTIISLSALSAAALIAVPVLAQEAESKEERKVERIVIMEHDETKGEHKDGERRVFRVHRGGEGMRRHVMVDCEDGEKTEVSEGAEGDKQRTRIVLCAKGGGSAEERAKRLEEIRSKLAEREHLIDEHRARLEAALTKAIERLRASN